MTIKYKIGEKNDKVVFISSLSVVPQACCTCALKVKFLEIQGMNFIDLLGNIFSKFLLNPIHFNL